MITCTKYAPNTFLTNLASFGHSGAPPLATSVKFPPKRLRTLLNTVFLNIERFLFS